MTPRRRFWHIAGAGTAFQAGSAAVDSATVMSALVFQLTGSAVAVGAISTILRLGWLLPQLVVGYLAGRTTSTMPFYVVGAFGRTAAIFCLAVVLWMGASAGWSHTVLGAITLSLWTVYACLSGIVGVPYNDIVARSVPSDRRSRLLAIRFFGGGLVALAVVTLADRLVRMLEFPISYAAILGIAAFLMLVSSVVFTTMGEPKRTVAANVPDSFWAYLREGISTFRTDPIFRRFVLAQWCGGAVLIAAPFFVVAAETLGVGFENVALLLGSQTAGALAANPLWGWWGDRLGKLSLMRAIAVARVAPPLVVLALLFSPVPPGIGLVVLITVFFILGALTNGLTIAVIGLLMEISPNERRPSYSGYFNALTAPAFVFPLLGGFAVTTLGTWIVFAVALVLAVVQATFLFRIELADSVPLARHSGKSQEHDN